MIVDGVDNRRLVDLGHGNGKGRRIAERRHAVVGYSDDEGIGSRPLFFAGRPREEAAGRIDGGAVRGGFVEAEGELGSRIVGVRGLCREREGVAFVDGPVGNRAEHGRFQGHVERA